MRSASANTASMSCSTSTMVTSRRSSCSSLTMRADSVMPRPAIGSSSSNTCGEVASATASSSSRCSPWLNFDTRMSARGPRPTRSSAANATWRRRLSLRALPQNRNECPSWACAASATLSAAVKSSSSEVNWLISVVLPAPFGPMIACNSPRATSSETWSVATMPPNRLTRFSTQSRGSATGKPPQQSIDAAAPEQHDQQQQRAHDQRPVFGDLRQELLQHQVNHRADHRAEQRAHAAEDDHHHQVAGAGPVHHRRADEIGVVGEQRAGEAADGAGNDKTDQTVTRGRKSDRMHAPLVGAQALHHQAEARIDDPPDQVDAAKQAEQADIIELYAVRQVDQAGKIAALVDGETIVTAVTRQPGGDVIGHLGK